MAEADCADDLPALLDRCPCDVVLLELRVDRNTLADIEGLARRVRVVVLTASQVPSDTVAAIRKGARAVVFKWFAIETLLEAIRTVARGDVWLPACVRTQGAAQPPPTNALSPREEEVLCNVALGMRNAEAARALAISEQAVKRHLSRIFRKLGLRSRAELALFARRAGLGFNGIRDRTDG